MRRVDRDPWIQTLMGSKSKRSSRVVEHIAQFMFVLIVPIAVLALAFYWSVIESWLRRL